MSRETCIQQAPTECDDGTSSDCSGPYVESDSDVQCLMSCKHTFLTLSCWSAPIRRVQSAPQLGRLGPEMFELHTGSDSDAASIASTEAWGDASSGRWTTSNEVDSGIKPRVLRTHVSDSTVASVADVAEKAGIEHARGGALPASSGSHCIDNQKGNEHTAGGAFSFDAGLVLRFEALVDERYELVDAEARRRCIDGLLEAAAG